MKLLLIWLIAFSLISVQLPGQELILKDKLKGFEDFVAEVQSEWDVKGVAVGMVVKDSLVYAKGFGFRDYENQLPVTSETLFPLASNSKSFISFTICQLHDRGVININKPIKNYLPGLELSDKFLLDNLTAKDLLLQRSGFERHELVWIFSDESRAQQLERWKFVEPGRPLRDVFLYSAFNYLLLAYLVDSVSGRSWEDFTIENVFKPLDFRHSNFMASGLSSSDNFARPYVRKNSKIQNTTIREIGITGDVNSSVEDLSKWLILQLGGGKFKDRTLLSANLFNQMIEPQIVVPGYTNDHSFTASYGYGWLIKNYRDYLVIEHDGETEGFSCWISFLPSEDIGVIVLSNNNYSPVDVIIKNNLLDRMLNLPILDYSSIYLQAYRKREEEILAHIRNLILKEPKFEDSERFQGVYHNDAYGSVNISEIANRLHFILRGEPFRLFRVGDENFEMEDGDSIHFISSDLGIKGFTMNLQTLREDIYFGKTIPK